MVTRDAYARHLVSQSRHKTKSRREQFAKKRDQEQCVEKRTDKEQCVEKRTVCLKKRREPGRRETVFNIYFYIKVRAVQLDRTGTIY